MRSRLAVAAVLILLGITLVRYVKRVDPIALFAKPPIAYVEALNEGLPLMEGNRKLSQSSKADVLFVSATTSYIVDATSAEVIDFYRNIGARRGWLLISVHSDGLLGVLNMCGGEYSYQVDSVPDSMSTRVVVRTTWTMDKWSSEYCRSQDNGTAFRKVSIQKRQA